MPNPDSPRGEEEDEGRRDTGPKRTGRLSIERLFCCAKMKKDFRKAIAEEVLLADGAIGTLLTSRGASPEQARSPLNLSDPESVREVHEDYLDAGARILTTNTWDANRVKLTSHEWADSLEKINREGVRLAREAAAGELVVRRRIDRAARRARQALRLAAAHAGARDLRGAGARCFSSRASISSCSRRSAASSRRPKPCAPCAASRRRSRIVAEMTFLADGRTAFGEARVARARDPRARRRRRRRHELHARARRRPTTSSSRLAAVGLRAACR